MQVDSSGASFTVLVEEAGETLAALARAHAWAESWSRARRLVTSGKVFVAGRRELDPAARPPIGVVVELHGSAPRPQPEMAGVVVYEDSQVVVFDKPAGVSSVPFEEGERGTAVDLVRAHLRRSARRGAAIPLLVVHRIDRDTSGLLVFARTKPAERVLAAQFRQHSLERAYRCLAHGRVAAGTITSRLVADRGDGLRGSTRLVGRGQRAVSHVTVIAATGSASWCEVRLETGRTHQIRIHLAEAGHPLVGERVYIRDFVAGGGRQLAASRLMLHARTLGFVHPTSGEVLSFSSPLPPDLVMVLAAVGIATDE